MQELGTENLLKLLMPNQKRIFAAISLDAIQALHEEPNPAIDSIDQRIDALRACMQKLKDADVELDSTSVYATHAYLKSKSQPKIIGKGVPY